ncbi:MAG: class I SAM-dependent methyltransferase [Xanthobacteraceae bacterium]
MAESFIRDLGAKSHVDAVLATIGPVAGLRIIDVGCGEGQMSRALAALGADVVGYDPFIEETEPTAHGAGKFRLVRAAADAIPEPDQSADLVLFIFSLHHVPGAKLAGALAEARRVLRPSGRLYVAEPLPQGPHQYIMELFHDETAVRKSAAEALKQFARPRFAIDQVSTYTDARRYSDFEAFAERMIANMRFNGYSREAVLAPAVRRRFDETYAASGDKFDQPVRIDCFGPAS